VTGGQGLEVSGNFAVIGDSGLHSQSSVEELEDMLNLGWSFYLDKEEL
jgi:hypothetical protein